MAFVEKLSRLLAEVSRTNPGLMILVQDEGLKKLLMSWYYAGFCELQ